MKLVDFQSGNAVLGEGQNRKEEKEEKNFLLSNCKSFLSKNLTSFFIVRYFSSFFFPMKYFFNYIYFFFLLEFPVTFDCKPF